MSSYTCTITAAPEHIDALGHVNNAVWVRWMEQVATEHWQRDAGQANIDAYLWVVTRHEIDYRGNVEEGAIVTARTWVDGPPRISRFDRRIEFTGPDGKLKVSAKSTWVIVNRADLRVVRIPPDVGARFWQGDAARP